MKAINNSIRNLFICLLSTSFAACSGGDFERLEGNASGSSDTIGASAFTGGAVSCQVNHLSSEQTMTMNVGDGIEIDGTTHILRQGSYDLGGLRHSASADIYIMAFHGFDLDQNSAMFATYMSEFGEYPVNDECSVVRQMTVMMDDTFGVWNQINDIAYQRDDYNQSNACRIKLEIFTDVFREQFEQETGQNFDATVASLQAETVVFFPAIEYLISVRLDNQTVPLVNARGVHPQSAALNRSLLELSSTIRCQSNAIDDNETPNEIHEPNDSNEPELPICQNGADSDPDGDGYGWENNQSCLVAGK